MAPEIKNMKKDSRRADAFGKYGHPIDVFGFGLVAQWLLTGKFQTAKVVSGM